MNHHHYHAKARLNIYSMSSSSSIDRIHSRQEHQEMMNSNRHVSESSSSSIEEEGDDYIDEDDDLSVQSNSNDHNRTKTKKTLGRVKIKMAFIDNKIRRYTTFSKRKTGIMKKAYELATLTGTEVMLLVASETGHVYTYATAKLQPMITSEAGKALIQTCLAKDEPIVETVDIPNSTTLNNNDVIFVNENQRKRRTNGPVDVQSHNSRPNKRTKLNDTNEFTASNQIKTNRTVNPSSSPQILLPTLSPSTTTMAVPLSCLINPDGQPSSSFTIDINSLKNNGMNIIFAPPSLTQPTSPTSVVLKLSNFPFQSS